LWGRPVPPDLLGPQQLQDEELPLGVRPLPQMERFLLDLAARL